MSGRKTIFLLLIVVAIALFFRVYDLKNAPPGLYGDEAVNGNNAAAALATGATRVFYEENNGREGLFINIQALTIKLFGNEPWALRLPSAVFGILTVLGVYFLTRELFEDRRIALLAAFLVAVSFWHINFSRIGFRAIMAPAFLTWGLYLLLRSFRNSKFLPAGRQEKFRNWPLPILAGLVYGLGMHSYIAYRATPLLIVAALAICGKIFDWKQTLKIGAIFIVAAFIVFLPLGLYFLEHPADFLGRTSGISIFNSPTPLKTLGLNILKTAGMFNFAGDWNPRHNVPGAPLLYWPVGILFILGLLNGFFNKKMPSRFAFWIVFLWLIIAALPVVASNEGLPHALRAVLMSPAVFMIAALGGVWLFEKLRPIGPIRPIGLIGLIGFFLLITLNAYQIYFLDWAKRPDVAEAFDAKYVKIAGEINALPANTAKYLVIDTGGHDVRKIGSPAQTVMFLTDTYLPEKQEEKNIRFIKPEELLNVPSGSFVVNL